MSTRVWVLMATAVFVLSGATIGEARIRRGGHEKRRAEYRQERESGYTQEGFQLYASIGGQGYEIGDPGYPALEELDSEGSASLGASIGLNRRLALFLEGTASEHETIDNNVLFGNALLGLKYAPNVGSRHKTQPYGKVGLGCAFLFEDESSFSDHDGDNGYLGPALGLALGIDHYVGRRTALFGEIGMTTGEFDTRVIDDEEFDLPRDIDVTSGRIQFGLRVRL